MRIAVILCLGIAICYFLQSYLPIWWIFAPVTFIISLAVQFTTGWRSFFYGLLIVFITWMLLYLIKDIPNDQVMSSKMANLFNFKNAYSLFIVISLIMGIVGGLASTAAYYIRKR